MTDLAAKIHKGIYGKSDKLNASENNNADFKSGFEAGNNSPSDNWQPIWDAEWTRRGGPECDWERWREWKRGWHASRLQRTLSRFSSQRSV